VRCDLAQERGLVEDALELDAVLLDEVIQPNEHALRAVEHLQRRWQPARCGLEAHDDVRKITTREPDVEAGLRLRQGHHLPFDVDVRLLFVPLGKGVVKSSTAGFEAMRTRSVTVSSVNGKVPLTSSARSAGAGDAGSARAALAVVADTPRAAAAAANSRRDNMVRSTCWPDDRGDVPDIA